MITTTPLINTSLRAKFITNGYIVIRGLLNQEEVEYYKKELQILAGEKQQNWTVPDGVSKNKSCWDIIFNERLVETVRSIFGEEAKYLAHNDLHVGFSSLAWHRDSVNRNFGEGPDWDESNEPYRLARVGIYLQEYKQSGFRFGLIKGTHRPDVYLADSERKTIERRSSGIANAFSVLTKKDLLSEKADWIATEPGDCVIFDPRTLHTGSRFEGVKYSLFTAYGIPNTHFYNHQNYYRHLRTDLNYQDPAPELVERLKAAGLYAPPKSLTQPIDGAWVPSKAFAYVASKFK